MCQAHPLWHQHTHTQLHMTVIQSHSSVCWHTPKTAQAQLKDHNKNLNLASLSPPAQNITEPHWMCRCCLIYINARTQNINCAVAVVISLIQLIYLCSLMLLLISVYRWCSLVDATWYSAVPEWRDPQSPSRLQIMFTYGSHSELPSVELFVQIYPLADSHSHTVFIISFCLVLCEYFNSGDTNTTFDQPSYRRQ